MGYALCIAEKPSVARDIARVIGANIKKDGYLMGEKYIVTWAVGHLVGLAEPEAYGYVAQHDMYDREQPQCKIKAFDELPLFPEKFKTVVLEKTKPQFQVIKELMHREDVDYIIDCGDMGAEGHILQWLIREQAGNTKSVMRFCATSLTEEAIRESMSKLREIKDFEPIILGEFCKKRADWILGMSMSRCASLKYNARVDVGRVLSPTLFFVVRRFIETQNFKVTDYYQLKGEFEEGFTAFWKKDNNNSVSPSDKDSENRLTNKAAADGMAPELQEIKTGVISTLKIKEKSTPSPQLYDITELQRDGNRLYGYSASDVLAAAQSLYETHKVLSYPRTDSRYITTDLEPYLIPRLTQIASLPAYADIANQLLSDGLNIDKRLIDDGKVTDHHALIVTEKIQGFNFSALTETEANILNLVISRMMVTLCPKYVYEETSLSVAFSNGISLTVTGNKPLSMGWKAVQKRLAGSLAEDETESAETQLFPELRQGQSVTLSGVSVLSQKTTPPKLHTEATLLTAMETAGSVIEGGAILKGKGIGTQATRAAIIKSLFDKGYMVNQKVGKVNYLTPTKQGVSVIKALPPDLYSPKITADWEAMIADIVSGKRTERDFMLAFEEFIKKKIDEVKNGSADSVDFSREHEEFDKCPWCGASVYEWQEKVEGAKKTVGNYYCSAKCGFSIKANNPTYANRAGKHLSVRQIHTLIKSGEITAKCVNQNGREYAAKFSLEKVTTKTGKTYTSLIMSFADDKKP